MYKENRSHCCSNTRISTPPVLRALLARTVVMGLTLFFVLSCTSQKSPNSPPPTQLEMKTKLLARGRVVYAANCTACHNSNPALNGSIGPSLAASSFELLQARLIQGTYPAGYTPKRATGQMPKFPHLANDLRALFEYLNQPVEAFK